MSIDVGTQLGPLILATDATVLATIPPLIVPIRSPRLYSFLHVIDNFVISAQSSSVTLCVLELESNETQESVPSHHSRTRNVIWRIRSARPAGDLRTVSGSG